VAAVATYKMIKVAGTSPESFAKAAQGAVQEAAKTLRSLGWFEVKELRGRIQDGKIAEYQVMVEIGFKLE
jgi:flavin-binding protein dodecin